MISYSHGEHLKPQIRKETTTMTNLNEELFTKSDKEYKVGDVVSFKLEYGAVLKLATSKYVEKAYI